MLHRCAYDVWCARCIGCCQVWCTCRQTFVVPPGAVCVARPASWARPLGGLGCGATSTTPCSHASVPARSVELLLIFVLTDYASPSRRSATASERCSQRSSKPSIAREATNQRVSGRLATMSNTDRIPSGAAEYVAGHPIYAFYRHLWREDRLLFAKVCSVAFIHGLDLLYSVPYLYVAERAALT